jgi:hypothetical protein
MCTSVISFLSFGICCFDIWDTPGLLFCEPGLHQPCCDPIHVTFIYRNPEILDSVLLWNGVHNQGFASPFRIIIWEYTGHFGLIRWYGSRWVHLPDFFARFARVAMHRSKPVLWAAMSDAPETRASLAWQGVRLQQSASSGQSTALVA